MDEAIVLGIIQGVGEWLPISSEGLFYLVKTKFFLSRESLDVIVKEVLFLHLGTFLAALLYFRQEVWRLVKSLLDFKKAEEIQKKTLKFLIVSTLISGALGFLLLLGFERLDMASEAMFKLVTIVIGIMLLITALLQIKASVGGFKKPKQLTVVDGVLLGIIQGIAVLPGLSRSGLTISALLLRKFDKVSSLKLSFLMSLPIVLVGNIIINFSYLTEINRYVLIALLFSFVFGWLTIDVLLKIAKKINFGYFVLLFGLLTILSVFV